MHWFIYFSFIRVPIYLLTRSFIYPFIYSPVHPYNHLFTHSFIHVRIYLLTRSCLYLFIYSLVHSCTYLFTYSFIHVPIYLLSFIHVPIYLLTRSSMYLFIYSPVRPYKPSYLCFTLAPMGSSSIPTLLQSGILIISPTERAFARGLHITSAQSVGNRKHRETDSPLGFSLPQPSSRALPAVTSSSVKVTSS